MMKYSRHMSYLMSVLIVILLLFVAGCSEESQNQNTPTDPGNPNLPADPGSGNLAGKVIGTINGQPLIGVQVQANGKTTSTDSDGNFLLSGVGEGSFGVEISGDQIYTHLAAVNTANGRSVLLDAIEVSSSFHLGFYREIARGNHPNERNIYPTHRWISSPTFYIDTDASATVDGVIDQNQINTVIDVIKQVLPVFTGGVYTSVKIVQKPFTSLNFDNDIPDNAFVLSFDDSLAWRFNALGFTQTDPTFISPSTSSINKSIVRLVDDMSFYDRGGISFEEVVAHEMGHGFGFRHTSLLPSVMVAVGAFGGLYGEIDRIHMKIVYSRPAGNSDIDNDPIPGAKQIGQTLGRQVFIDRRATFPLTPEEVEQLRALPTKIPAKDLLKHQSAY